MKNQALFSSKDKSKNLKCSLLQFLGLITTASCLHLTLTFVIIKILVFGI